MLTNPLNFASSSPTTYDKANIMNFLYPTQRNFKKYILMHLVHSSPDAIYINTIMQIPIHHPYP